MDGWGRSAVLAVVKNRLAVYLLGVILVLLITCGGKGNTYVIPFPSWPKA